MLRSPPSTRTNGAFVFASTTSGSTRIALPVNAAGRRARYALVAPVNFVASYVKFGPDDASLFVTTADGMLLTRPYVLDLSGHEAIVAITSAGISVLMISPLENL